MPKTKSRERIKSTEELRGTPKRTEDNMPDFYRVKYRQVRFPDGKPIKGRKGNWRYGIHEKYNRDAKDLWINDNALIIEDAVLPTVYEVSLDLYEVCSVDWDIDKDWDDNDYERFIAKEFEEAQKASDKAGKGLHVNKLFSVGVADGMAFYIVTRVNKKTVAVEWRGFWGGDRYVDQILGYKGTFPKSAIERNVSWMDFKDSAFRRKR